MNHEPLHNSACGNLRLQRLILRITALISLIALPAIILPRLAMEKLSWLTGFGQPPDVPLLVYVAAGGAAVFVGQAGFLWILSGDVVRYRPLVLYVGWVYTACGPAFLWIDRDAGMPHWWVAMDSLGSLIVGGTLLWACRPCKRQA